MKWMIHSRDWSSKSLNFSLKFSTSLAFNLWSGGFLWICLPADLLIFSWQQLCLYFPVILSCSRSMFFLQQQLLFGGYESPWMTWVHQVVILKVLLRLVPSGFRAALIRPGFVVMLISLKYLVTLGSPLMFSEWKGKFINFWSQHAFLCRCRVLFVCQASFLNGRQWGPRQSACPRASSSLRDANIIYIVGEI